MKIEIDTDEIVNKIVDKIKSSLESKTFEIGEFARNLTIDETGSISSVYIGKKVISKIIEIIENDLEDIC